MKINPKQYAQALFESLESTDPKALDTVLDNFAKVLAENNDLKLFDQIAVEFEKLELNARGVKTAEVTSARPLSRENEHAIVEQLNKIVKQDIKLSKKLDEDIIGGVIVKMDDVVIDASVKNSLNQLKDNLGK